MLTITLGIGLTLLLVTKALVMHHAQDMGTMSDGWVAAYAASQPTPSI